MLLKSNFLTKSTCMQYCNIAIHMVYLRKRLQQSIIHTLCGASSEICLCGEGATRGEQELFMDSDRLSWVEGRCRADMDCTRFVSLPVLGLKELHQYLNYFLSCFGHHNDVIVIQVLIFSE